jgi:hypothetical protein
VDVTAEDIEREKDRLLTIPGAAYLDRVRRSRIRHAAGLSGTNDPSGKGSGGAAWMWTAG